MSFEVNKETEAVVDANNTQELEENKIPHNEELVYDDESGSMITREDYMKKVKAKLENPNDNSAR